MQKLRAAQKQTKAAAKEEGTEKAPGTKKGKQKEPQISISDPQARFMKTSDNGVAPSLNGQVTADAEHDLIVDVEVGNDPQDAQQLIPAMDRIAANCGRDPRQALADGGYTNHESVVAMAERGIDYYGSLSGRTEQLSGCGAQRHPDYQLDKFEHDSAANEKICPQRKASAANPNAAFAGRAGNPRVGGVGGGLQGVPGAKGLLSGEQLEKPGPDGVGTDGSRGIRGV